VFSLPALPPVLALALVGALVYLLLNAGSASAGDSSGTPSGGDGASGGGALPGPHNEYDNQIVYACNQAGIADPAVYVRLKAILQQESGFDPAKVGDNGISLGLGQINTEAHPDLAQAYNLLDPNQNILAAAQVLAGCLQETGGDLDAATRCYNGSGPQTLVYLASVQSIQASWGA
jgi:Transglycosylase SLT domain